jgi:hypothetical protein
MRFVPLISAMTSVVVGVSVLALFSLRAATSVATRISNFSGVTVARKHEPRAPAMGGIVPAVVSIIIVALLPIEWVVLSDFSDLRQHACEDFEA